MSEGMRDEWKDGGERLGRCEDVCKGSEERRMCFDHLIQPRFLESTEGVRTGSRARCWVCLRVWCVHGCVCMCVLGACVGTQ